MLQRLLLCSALLCSFTASAADPAAVNAGGWKGSGELGFALARGNTKSESLNAKLNFDRTSASWNNNVYATALRSKGEVKLSQVINGETVTIDGYEATANRFEVGGSAGYRFSPRSSVVGALRYERDDFASNRWQAAASLGYGHTLIENERAKLAFEIGPGYKRVQPVDAVEQRGTPPVDVLVHPDSESGLIWRGLLNAHYQLTGNTALDNKLLIEAGSDGRFLQNDAGLVVNMSERLALKLGYQMRYNSEVAPGAVHRDQLLTTNLVYRF